MTFVLYDRGITMIKSEFAVNFDVRDGEEADSVLTWNNPSLALHVRVTRMVYKPWLMIWISGINYAMPKI
jgi:hypothetical protein